MRRVKKTSGAWLVGVLAVAMLLAGCGGDVSAGTLGSTMWELSELNNRDVLDDVSVTMHLGEDDELSGTAGCNRYFGSWQTTGEGYDITLEASGTTMMACDQAIMDQEQEFLAALASAVTFDLEEDELELFDANGKEVAEFDRLKPASLSRTPWQATAINNGQGALVTVLDGTSITAVVDNIEMRVSGNGGCNTFGGDVSRDGDVITVGSLFSTMMACDQPVMDQELMFLQALERAHTYELGHETLYLRAEDGSMLVMFREND